MQISKTKMNTNAHARTNKRTSERANGTATANSQFKQNRAACNTHVISLCRVGYFVNSTTYSMLKWKRKLFGPATPANKQKSKANSKWQRSTNCEQHLTRCNTVQLSVSHRTKWPVLWWAMISRTHTHLHREPNYTRVMPCILYCGSWWQR